jgi:hypothetical protein
MNGLADILGDADVIMYFLGINTGLINVTSADE